MDVFISYSTKDKKIADAICHCLEEDKIKCWIAPRDIRPGHAYASEIVTAIKECQVFLLVFSSNTNHSEHVANEIEMAYENESLIIPFRIENSELNNSLSYYLKRKHWIDAFPNPKENFKELSHKLQLLLSSQKPETPKPVGPKPPVRPKYKKLLLVLISVLLILVTCLYFIFPIKSNPEFLAFTKLNGKYGYINLKGEETIDFQYKKAYSFSHGLAPVLENDKWHYINIENKKIFGGFEMATPFRENMAGVKGKEGWYYIDMEGNRVLDTSYDFLGGFNEGLSTFRQNDKWGYMDKNGNEVIDNLYDLARSFSDGLAAVKKENFWGVINRKGEEIIPFKYTDINDFAMGIIPVKLSDNNWVLINEHQQKILDDTYEDVKKAAENVIVIKKDGSWGAIDKNGQEVIPFIYERLGVFSNGFAAALKDGKWGYIDNNNKEIIKFKYEYADNFKKTD